MPPSAAMSRMPRRLKRFLQKSGARSALCKASFIRLAWLAGAAVHDLRQPDSRIKAFARRLLEKRKAPQRVRTIVVEPSAIEGPDDERDHAGGGGNRR